MAEVVSANVNPGEVQTLFTASTWSLITVKRAGLFAPSPLLGFHRTIAPLGDSPFYTLFFFPTVFLLAPGDVVFVSSPAGAAIVNAIVSPLP